MACFDDGDETDPAAVVCGTVVDLVDVPPVHPPMARTTARDTARTVRMRRENLIFGVAPFASADVNMGSSSLGGRFAAVNLATIRQPRASP